MRHPMSQTARRESIASIGSRYREARWDDKQRILDEFTAATGCHRKYAIAVLNHPPAERPLPIHRPRGQRYDAEIQAALMCLWEAAGGDLRQAVGAVSADLARSSGTPRPFAVIRGGTGAPAIHECRDGGPPDTHSAAQPSRG